MSKFSYRFDGSSFTGQRYTYVGPASSPCRKVLGPSSVEMISKDSGWALSGDNSYIYTDCDNFCSEWGELVEESLVVLCEPYTPPVYIGTFPLDIDVNYTLGNPITYKYEFEFAFIRIYKSGVLHDTIVSYIYAETLKYTFNTSGSYRVYFSVIARYTGKDETGCSCGVVIDNPEYNFLLS